GETKRRKRCRDFKDARAQQGFSIEAAAPAGFAEPALNNILSLEPMLPPRFLTALRHAVYHFNKTTHVIVPVKLCFGSFSAILTQSSSQIRLLLQQDNLFGKVRRVKRIEIHRCFTTDFSANRKVRCDN